MTSPSHRAGPLVPLDNAAVAHPVCREPRLGAVSLAQPPAVELSKRPPPFKLIIDVCQDMNRLVDAADLGHGLFNSGPDGRQPGACA